LSRVRVRGVVIAGCALFGLVSGCSSSHSAKPPAPTTTVATTTTAPTTTTSTSVPSSTSTTTGGTTTTAVAAGPTVAALILKVAPSQYPLQPDSAADTGPTGVHKAALDDVLSSPAAATAILRRDGFVAGYQRQWANAGNVGQNFIFLYQFATPAGAQAYVQHWAAAIESADSGTAPVAFTPAVVPGATGLQAHDADGAQGVVLFTKGPYAVQALSTISAQYTAKKPTYPDQSGPASLLAAAQYALLP
jgi:hypothetical protein